MIIFEEINKKHKRIGYFSYLFWFILLITIFMKKSEIVSIVQTICALGFFGTILYNWYVNKCPKCGTSLVLLNVHIPFPSSTFDKKNNCPGCGIRLNTEVEL